MPEGERRTACDHPYERDAGPQSDPARLFRTRAVQFVRSTPTPCFVLNLCYDPALYAPCVPYALFRINKLRIITWGVGFDSHRPLQKTKHLGRGLSALFSAAGDGNRTLSPK